MPAQKIAKNLPKRATNAHLKEYRKRAFANGLTRKGQRDKDNQARHAANLAAGKTPRRQTRRRKADNMRVCLRCTKRVIVAGSVCWCKDLPGTGE